MNASRWLLANAVLLVVGLCCLEWSMQAAPPPITPAVDLRKEAARFHHVPAAAVVPPRTAGQERYDPARDPDLRK